MNASATPAKVPGRILVENVRLSMTDSIWKAGKPPNTTGEEAYSCHGIISRNHPQIGALVALINAAAQKQWKEHWQTILAQAQAAGKVFLKDGNIKSKFEGYAGNLFITTRVAISKGKPKVYDGMLNGKPKEVQNRQDSRIYSGCYGNLLIDVFSYIKGSNGVSAGFKAVQFLKDGEPLGGGAPAQDDEMAVVEESAQAANEFGAIFGIPSPAGNAGFQL